MDKGDAHSRKSAALARGDKEHLLRSIAVARGLGAVPPGNAPPSAEDDPSFDPALDLPLGMELALIVHECWR